MAINGELRKELLIQNMLADSSDIERDSEQKFLELILDHYDKSIIWVHFICIPILLNYYFFLHIH